MRWSHTVSCIYGRMYKKMCVTGFHNACDGRVNKDRQRSACCLRSRKLLVGCSTEPGRVPTSLSVTNPPSRRGGSSGPRSDMRWCVCHSLSCQRGTTPFGICLRVCTRTDEFKRTKQSSLKFPQRLYVYLYMERYTGKRCGECDREETSDRWWDSNPLSSFG